MWRKLPPPQVARVKPADHRPNVRAWKKLLDVRRALGVHPPLILRPNDLLMVAEAAQETMDIPIAQTMPHSRVALSKIPTQPLKQENREWEMPAPHLSDFPTQPLGNPNIVTPRITLPLRQKRGA